jgi:hypothetical protein
VKANVRASAGASSTAIAICNGSASGTCGSDPKKPGTVPERPDIATPGQPPKPSDVPTIDPNHPRPADLPYLHGLVSGWKG